LSNNRTNDLIARAGEDFLYGNDLPNFTSEEDSIRSNYSKKNRKKA